MMYPILAGRASTLEAGLGRKKVEDRKRRMEGKGIDRRQTKTPDDARRKGME